MKKNKKLISIITATCLTLSIFSGCNKGSEDGRKKAEDSKIVYFATSTEPYINLDPSVENSNGIAILQNTYETLTFYNYETREVEPLLAESWKSENEGKTWIFKIKDGVKFHDGEELNAEVVKKSIERTKELNLGAAFIWESLESIEVVSEYEVQFNLKYSAPIDLIASAGYASYIISPKAIDKDSQWFNEGNNAGTGPYTIKKLTKGEEVILEKFDDYWGGWKENQYSHAIIKKVSEGSARRQLIEKGEAQIASEFSTTDIKALREYEGVKVEEMPSWKNIIGFFNTEKEPLNNVEFRKALAYAFPYEETINNIKEGMAVQSYGLVPSGLWGHNEELFRYKCDLEKAKEHLDKSGVDVSNLTLEITASGGDAFRNYAQLYQINLKKLGINLEIREMNWDSVWEKSKSVNKEDRQDILVMSWWPDYATPLSWFASLVKSEENPTFNLSYINDPEIDKKIEEASLYAATDREKAEKLLIEIQEKLIEESYFLHIYDDQTVWVTTDKLKGFNINPAYGNVVHFYDLYEE